MNKTRRLLVVATVAVAAGSFTSVAYGGVEEPPTCDPKVKVCPPPPPPPDTKSHCNAGNGNGSDAITTDPTAHCYMGDPGNSYNAGNRGGDEIPTSNGVPNPGGNNVDVG